MAGKITELTAATSVADTDELEIVQGGVNKRADASLIRTVASVNGNTGTVVLDPDDLDDTSTTHKFATAAELAKIGHISVTQAVDLDTMESNIVTNNAQTGTSYTGVLADASKVVTMNNASANTFTVPANASAAYPTGTVIVIQQIGAGTTTVTGDTGVTVNGVSAGSGDLSAQWSAVSLLKTASDTWLAMGDIGTVA